MNLAIAPSYRAAFDPRDVLDDFRLILRARFLDEAENGPWKTKTMFRVPGAGQEMAQIASVKYLQPGDWDRSYYRSTAASLKTKVMTVRQMAAQLFGDTTPGKDPSSGGRMMEHHHGTRILAPAGLIDLTQQVNHASDTSSTGTQLPVAFGLARASRFFREAGTHEAFRKLSRVGKEVVLVTVGDGSLAEGTCFEAIAQAVVQKVPLVICVMDNEFAISVRGDLQVPHGDISKTLKGFTSCQGGDGLRIMPRVEGWDYSGLCMTFEKAIAHARAGIGPVLVHVKVQQPLGHSSSGSHERYKDNGRLSYDKDSKWIDQMKLWMLDEGIATAEHIADIAAEEKEFVDSEIAAAWQEFRMPLTELGERALTILRSVESSVPGGLKDAIEGPTHRLREKVSREFDHERPSRSEITLIIEQVLTEATLWVDTHSAGLENAAKGFLQQLRELRDRIDRQAREDYSSTVYASGAESPCTAIRVDPEWPTDRNSRDKYDTQAHIISGGIATLMTENPRVIVTGEDVGKLGGVLQTTIGLQSGRLQIKGEAREALAIKRYVPDAGFGVNRIWDHGIAESTIVGGAVGMALRGLRPIVEIQFVDYLVWGLQQIVDEAASLRHRTDGGQACPMLIRTPGHREKGMWHSGSPLGMILSACPGVRVLVPRNGVQAIAMYRAVLAGGDPAISIEPLTLMATPQLVPENLDTVCLPLGQSEVLRPGSDVTIVTYGYCCEVALEAAKTLARYGVEAEVIDLQTLNPLDLNGVAEASIRRTGAAVFLDEDIPEGASAVIAKKLMFERGLFWSDEMPSFVTAPHHKPPYGTDGRFFCKPEPRDVIVAVLGMPVVIDSASKRRGRPVFPAL